MDSKDPKMSLKKYMEMIREAKNRKDVTQGSMIPEPVATWFEARGINVDTFFRLEPLLRKYEGLTEEEKTRFKELKNFEPKPGKATLNQIGETKTYVTGDHGLPIYQEDIDMIKKSQPLAKKLVELQKKNQDPVDEKQLSEMTAQERIDYWCAKEEEEEQTRRTLRDTIDEVYDVKPEELNVGPDTTENINEIGDNYPGAGDWKEWRDEHADVLEPKDSGDVMFGADLETQGMNIEAGWYKLPERLSREFWEEYYKNKAKKAHNEMKEYKAPAVEENNKNVSQGVEKDEDEKTPDIMWYFDPESERFKPVEESNKNVSQEKIKESFGKTQEANICMGIRPGEYYKYSNILKRMDDTHTRKNNDYGDAAYQGYKKYGDYYFLVQLHNKLSRLESLTIENKTQMVKDESIDDTLLDMANYAIMFLESRHRND